MKVCKFGGSSVSSSKQFEAVKNIINSDEERKVIVCSACGKRNTDDYKITDLLYLTFAHLKYSVSEDTVYNIIEDRFIEIEKNLGVSINIKEEFLKLRNELNKNMNVDYLVSRGEYFTSKLLAKYLDYEFVDAKDVIKFNYDNTINYELTKLLVQNAVDKFGKIVVPGFYGSYDNDTIKIMARGGSDISGSILANVLDATVYENYTDVSGLLMCDPRIIDNPKQIALITYDELRELSYMGASVLHEDAISPVRAKNIPINILNSFDQSSKGTMIVNDVVGDNKHKDGVITGITGKSDFTSITVYKSNASNEIGLLAKALTILAKYKLSVEQIPSGIDNFSIVVSTEDYEKVMYELIPELRNELKTTSIKVENDLSLIAIVGRNMAHNIGVSGRLFQTLGNNDINIRMIIQGSDEINIIIGVNTKDFKKTIKVLYDVFS